MKKLIFGALLLASLQACNSDNTPTEQNPLVFTEINPSVFIDNTSFVNDVSGGSGTGTLSWASSDTEIATVDSTTGLVTPKDDGVVEIFVTKAADEDYLSMTSSYQLTIEKYQRETIGFRYDELLLPLTGPTVANEIVGLSEDSQDNLSAEFGSRNTEVAEVNVETGEITVVAKGDTVISAFIPESHLYYDTTISYDLSIRTIIENTQVNLNKDWVRVTWEAIDTPVTLILAESSNCSLATIASCVNAVSTLLNADSPQTLSLSNYNLASELFITIETDSYSSNSVLVEKQEPPFKYRIGGRFAYFNNEIWFVGGHHDEWYFGGDTNVKWYNDVWSSPDGFNWTQRSSDAAFGARSDFQLLNYQDHLYLIGGKEGSGNDGALSLKADVWRSSDGIHWELLNEKAPFFGGTTGQAIVFKDKMYVLGGGAFYRTAILYSSTDGIDWNIENDLPPFDNIDEHELFVWNDKLFMIGGYSSPGSENVNKNIYSTADGETWTLEGQLPENLSFLNTTVMQHDDELLMIGGVDQISWSIHNSVYRSTNGVDWSLVTSEAVADLNSFHEVFTFNNRLSIYSYNNPSRIWYSDDGAAWYLNYQLSIDWQVK